MICKPDGDKALTGNAILLFITSVCIAFNEAGLHDDNSGKTKPVAANMQKLQPDCKNFLRCINKKVRKSERIAVVFRTLPTSIKKNIQFPHLKIDSIVYKAKHWVVD